MATGLELDERRLLDALRERERAAVAEAAALRRVEQRRRPPGDAGEPALANRAPASGSEPISMRVYGWRGSLTIALAGPCSTSLPAYMTMILSAIW